jgi:FkbM family methyltransferase
MGNIDLDFLREGNPSVFDEVVTRNSYGLDQGCFKDQLVVDVGAHMGTFAYMAHFHGQADKVICVEPNAKNYKRLDQCFGDHKSFLLYNCAASHNYEPVLISDEDNNSKVGHGSKVFGMPLEEITRGYQPYLGHAILKMDIEGSEYDVLWSAHRRDITFFKTIFIETHISQAKHHAMCEYLFQFGYKLTNQNQMFFWWTQPDGQQVGHRPLDAWVSRFDL